MISQGMVTDGLASRAVPQGLLSNGIIDLAGEIVVVVYPSSLEVYAAEVDGIDILVMELEQVAIGTAEIESSVAIEEVDAFTVAVEQRDDIAIEFDELLERLFVEELTTEVTIEEVEEVEVGVAEILEQVSCVEVECIDITVSEVGPVIIQLEEPSGDNDH